jgi:hypothetical protein
MVFYYLAVRCRENPSHVILLKRVEPKSKRCRETLPLEFRAECPECGDSQRFDGRQVTGFLYPHPIKNFQTHPNFR